jgi:hypothetical protein
MLEGDRPENKSANNPEHEAAIECDNASDKLPPIPALSEPPEVPSSTAAPEYEPSKWRENTKLGLEIAGVLILIVYTVFTAMQWHQIRRTNDLTAQALKDSGDSLGKTLDKMQLQVNATNSLYGEAQKQTAQAAVLAHNSSIQAAQAKVSADAAKSAADTAIAGTRPWIKIDSVELRPSVMDIKTLMFHWPSSGLEVFPQYAGKELPPTLQVKVNMTNIGHSPAKDIEVKAELFFHKFDSIKWHDAVVSEEQRFCASAANQKPSSAAQIGYPSESLENAIGLSAIVKEADITVDNGVRYASAALVFCVNYKGVGDTPHQTQAWFGLYEDRNIGIAIGQDVDADHLRLIRDRNGDHAH